MSFLRPCTIRGQLILGLILLEGLLLLAFSVLTIREHFADVRQRAERRMQYQVSTLAADAAYAITDRHLDRLAKTLEEMRHTPTILSAQVTDPQGRSIASSDAANGGTLNLTAAEMARLPGLRKIAIFSTANGQQEAASPIFAEERLIGYAWIYANSEPDQQDLRSLLVLTSFYIVAAAFGCTLLATLMARSITRPLKVVLASTRQLVQHPEDTSAFPLKLSSSNEAADLANALNLMVASIKEQRAGLNDTLALLDSMLANAPIGFAFFDRRFKLVRINQFLANMNHMPIGPHLGRTVGEIMLPGMAGILQSGIEAVLESGEPVRDLDLTANLTANLSNGLPGPGGGSATEVGSGSVSWLANLYPVKSGSETVRWVGAIIVDTTERKRQEDALRKTEKLAATGRLAASIAHEINNPLEAVTNLLYLLRHHTPLDPQAVSYTELAQHEVARVSEITQQTLRFYRQSTLPLRSRVSDLLDSVLTLHQGRVTNLQVEVVREYRGDTELFCFAGELRQVFANLIGNALDAMNYGGGRLIVRVRRSRSWRNPNLKGVRVCIADTGTGMAESVRRRIFEPFFTTKEATGTGLGLWVSAEIIQKHTGTVRVRSRTAKQSPPTPGQPSPNQPSARGGTAFMLFFPELD